MNLRPFAWRFWEDRASWPIETKSHIFLARAVDALGEAIYGPSWTGDEGQALEIPQPQINDRRTVLAILSRDLDYVPDMNGADEAADYSRAMLVRETLNEDAKPRLLRFQHVCGVIGQAAVNEQVATFGRGAGGLRPIDSGEWFTDDWGPFFRQCEWQKHGGPVPVAFPIYLDRSQFEALLTAHQPTVAIQAVQSNNADKTRAIDFLRSVFEASPNERKHSNEVLRQMVNEHLGKDLALRSFKAAKVEAVRRAKTPAWSASGAPKTKTV